MRRDAGVEGRDAGIATVDTSNLIDV